MDKARNTLPNTAFHIRETRLALLPFSAFSPRGRRHQSERSRNCSPFFRVACPVSRWNAYITSKDKREEDRTGEGLPLKVTLLAAAREAKFSRSGIRSYFGFEDRILMSFPGQRPRRGVEVRCSIRPSHRRGRGLQVGDYVDCLRIPGPQGSVGRAELDDTGVSGVGTGPSSADGPAQRSGIV
jgi:hypothetical protein